MRVVAVAGLSQGKAKGSFVAGVWVRGGQGEGQGAGPEEEGRLD